MSDAKENAPVSKGKSKFYGHCGAQAASGLQFCTECGTKIDKKGR